MTGTGPSRYAYTWTTAAPPRAPVHTTSRVELRDIAIAFVVLTFDLTILFSGGSALAGRAGDVSVITWPVLLIAAGAALSGFVAHEMAHKFVAQRLGFWAEFRMSVMGLVFSVITSFIGFLFAAPGATMVGGMSSVDRREWGETSLAGPLTNVAFASIFFGVSTLTVAHYGEVTAGLLFLAFINTLFAGFNMLPLGPLDGAKVFRWSIPLWVTIFVTVLVVGGICYLASAAGTPFFFR